MTPAASVSARSRRHDGGWRTTAVVGATLTSAMAIAMAGNGEHTGAAAIAFAVGVALGALVFLASAVIGRLRLPSTEEIQAGLLLVVITGGAFVLFRMGSFSLVIAATVGLFGLALVTGEARERNRSAGQVAEQTPWDQIGNEGDRRSMLTVRLVTGGLLAGFAVLMIVLPAMHKAESTMVGIGVTMMALACVMTVVGIPLAVSVVASRDREAQEVALERERRRVAAHLHDSVLQTLALIQRRAGDPAAVLNLAHRQERALRAWLADDRGNRQEALADALQSVVDGIEDDEQVIVDFTVVGDREFDVAGEALAAAAREALRNAARHAAGSKLSLYAELSDDDATVFVRDTGPGFDPQSIAPERRGIRDSIFGRMSSVGGSAKIDSTSGDGTEVILTIQPMRTDNCVRDPQAPTESN